MKQASLFLKKILENNAAIVVACGNRIFPIAATAGIKDFPFVTFEHQSRAGDGTKDGSERVIDAMFSIVSRTALEAEELADSILPQMYAYYENPSLNEFADTFSEPDFVNEKELYADDVDAFMVSLQITFETI